MLKKKKLVENKYKTGYKKLNFGKVYLQKIKNKNQEL